MMSTINFHLVSRLRSAAVIQLPFIRPECGTAKTLSFYFTVGSNGGLCEHGTNNVDPNYQGCFT
jgi:hypothetical protein